MAISANTLFHFTKGHETLLNILMSKFYPRLCLEDSYFNSTNKKWAIPMVCFCDIPLSNIEQHTQKYGNYSIGIKKNWAIDQGVSPILYVHKKSCIVEQLRKTLYLSLDNSDTEGSAQTRLTEIMPILSMLKPYEREETINGVIQRIRYYDEREWRYILPIINGKFCILTEENYNKTYIRNEINKSNEQYGIDFTPDVINYIIVKRENEILL